MAKTYDVSAVCNALIDIVVEGTDADLHALHLQKARMHLVDGAAQKKYIDYFRDRPHGTELGGSALNAIRALAALELKTAFGGSVADDFYGRKIRDRLHELKIAGELRTVHEEPTGTCLCIITPDGERTMITALGASCLYDKHSVPLDDVAQSRIFHFCGYQWSTGHQKEAIMESVRIASNAGAKISFDVADPFVVNLYAADFRGVIDDHADIVFANREEAKLLYGLSPEETAKKIADTGAIAVIKLGSEGALIRKGKTEINIKPVPTKVVDTTAAGDVFAAGFLYGICTEKPLDECGRIGATLASDVISRHGTSISAEVVRKVLSRH